MIIYIHVYIYKHVNYDSYTYENIYTRSINMCNFCSDEMTGIRVLDPGVKLTAPCFAKSTLFTHKESCDGDCYVIFSAAIGHDLDGNTKLHDVVSQSVILM